MIRIQRCHWLIGVRLEDLWVSVCPIDRFDLHAGLRWFTDAHRMNTDSRMKQVLMMEIESSRSGNRKPKLHGVAMKLSPFVWVLRNGYTFYCSIRDNDNNDDAVPEHDYVCPCNKINKQSKGKQYVRK